MNSPLFEEWAIEERKEAAEKTTKDNIIYLLESKFEFVPNTIKKEVELVYDESILKLLLKKVLTVTSMEEFEELLNKFKMLS